MKIRKFSKNKAKVGKLSKKGEKMENCKKLMKNLIENCKIWKR